MMIWIDAQISPEISNWIKDEFSIECFHVRSLNLLRAKDSEIFFKAKAETVVVMTKDSDFVNLLEKRLQRKETNSVQFSKKNKKEVSL